MKEKVLKATYGSDETPLKIGEIEIPCYVLENGQRVLSQSGMFKALGISRGSTKDGRDRLTAFVSSNALKSFISRNLISVIEAPVKFIPKHGGTAAWGYDAETLQTIVRVVSKAYLTGNLQKQQEAIGARAEKLDDAFSKVGIIALIDEATGYQYEREKDELQKILKAYIAEELLPWQRKFPDVFYKELFRLNGWDFTVKGIKKRPGVIGIWTNKLVYEQLPKGVLTELKKKTPKSASGNYTARSFQSLTPETGNSHLTAQLNQIITLFQLSDNMEHMWNQFEKLKIRQHGQLALPFSFDKEGHTIEPTRPIYKEGDLSNFNKNLKIALEHNPKEEKPE